TLGATEGVAEAGSAAPRATTVDLPGLPLTGVWDLEISLRGIASHHLVTPGSGGANSLADIARILAASINATAADVFTATADGPVLVIVNRDGAAFGTRLTVGSTNVGVKAIDRSTPTEAAVNLSGTPATGEVWRIVLDDGATLPTTHQVTVGAS